MKLGIGVLGMIMGLMILLGVLPGMSKTALAADDYPLWVGETQVTPENATSPDHHTWSYDVGSNTLTLTNYTYSGEGYKAFGESYGIWYEGTGDLEIVMKGDSSITLNDNEESGIVGIHSGNVNAKLVISGEGSL